MTAAPAEAGGIIALLWAPVRVQYVHRPYYYSYAGLIIIRIAAILLFVSPAVLYYPRTYAYYRPDDYYDDAYYPSYDAAPSFGLSFAFGGSHWGGSHGGHQHH